MVVVKTYVEKIAEVSEWNNGAGPLWGRASAVIARLDDEVVVSLPELHSGITNLSRIRPVLYAKRGNASFRRVYSDSDHHTREPMPILRGPDGFLWMSANPMLGTLRTEGPATGDPSRPEMLFFRAGDTYDLTARETATWDNAYAFTEHSYRGCAIDAETGAFLLVNQYVEDGEGKFAWRFRDKCGVWSHGNRMNYPVRACYPAVALSQNRAHVLSVSDIIEPNPEWRQHKYAHSQRKWDYDFRILYYKYNPDVSSQDFSDSSCIASRDETCGQVMHKDIFVDAQNTCHILYATRRIWQPCMRDAFFPDVKFESTLEYARISEGAVVKRCIIDRDEEGRDGAYIDTSYCAAFHVLSNGDPIIVLSKRGSPAHAERSDGYAWAPLSNPDSVRPISLNVPATEFCLAGVRTGNCPCDTADLFLIAEGAAYYAAVTFA